MSSWLNPKTEKRRGPSEGRGLFARVAISAGEVVAVKGGAIMDRATFERVRNEASPAEIQIENDLYIAPRSAAEVEANLLCLNHSCDPNTPAFSSAAGTLHTLSGIAIDHCVIDREFGTGGDVVHRHEGDLPANADVITASD